MLEIAESGSKEDSYEWRLDLTWAHGARGNRDNDRMVLYARPAIRSRIPQPSLAFRTTFLTAVTRAADCSQREAQHVQADRDDEARLGGRNHRGMDSLRDD
jgi:hypothetical protein